MVYLHLRRYLLLCFLCVLISVFFATKLSAASFEYHEITLKNGMRAVLVPNTKVPAVSHMVWYNVGAADEVNGKTGVAHLLEHLMFKGTPTVGPSEFSKQVAIAGGNDNAFTSWDYTGYFQNIASDELALVMRLESDRMNNIVINDDALQSERLVVLEERRSRTDNNPSALLREQIYAALYPTHPYSRPIIGWEKDIRALTLKDVKAFYADHYAPNNATLVVTGAVPFEAFQALAEKYYGALPAEKTVARTIPRTSAKITRHRITYRDEKVKEPRWIRYYTAPQQTAKGCTECYALGVLSFVLAESRTSFLHKKLVVEQKLAVDVNSYYSDLNLGPSTFVLSATPAPDISLETLEAAIDATIKKTRSTPVTEAQLARAKDSLIAEAIYAQEDLSTLGRIFGQVYALGLDGRYITEWESHINNVTGDDVMNAARLVLKNANSVTGLLLPLEPQGE